VSATTPIVTGTDFVTVATTDLERARRFYADVLGLEESVVWQRPGSDPVGAELETGNLTLALLDSAALGLEFRPDNHPIALRVDDFEAARAELESRGVEFKGETIDSGVCYQAFFEDPDGNAVGIHHRYAPRR
jgi:catechol 2,3-dioxygenase-like lactoylglutathione lyase family enzyme